ncbi:RagB/SusD family nutrient uptake outer membrane protein [Paraflavitalea sp. CAU 1676]|uniref:RagB/SusD family nutrient uptake outer membrane protein n=1 Tax=Paraflavitalea sp. CAU 1676 TaxID=3032598 RepID=UPI0023DC78F9|nr:RagB/SusD family nutrient uptake outer membrane protein [Paraflavitalea sp. CAU 1676]MDF2188704.1 RagB/SusD family nutrient uptake outer membrane protein [Paraflavitalea sp. CAU 1676]
MLGGILYGLSGCQKLVDVPAPATSIPQHLVFSSDQEAISALAGSYYKMVNTPIPTLINGGMTIYCGLASDELVLFDQGNGPAMQFFQNNLQANNPIVGTNFWEATYQSIYQFNAILEAVQSAPMLSPAVKDQLTGQALFGRALLHFHLVAVFGPVPLITSTNWRTTNLQKRDTVATIYQHLIGDLKRAQDLLPAAYTLLPEGRTSANKWAAAALLAKIYSLSGNWPDVERECDKIIASGDYSLAATPSEVFLLNSSEAILQLKQDNTAYSFNATREGLTLLPIDGVFPFPPYGYLSTSVLAGFEPGDQRKADWTRSREINGNLLYYPAKYKVGPSQAEPGAPVLEAYMVLRLAEVFLLRAEARHQEGDLNGAIDDLNLIRQRASLPPLRKTLSGIDVFGALERERQAELFCEWGHRWIDLRRWNLVENVLSANKGHSVTASAQLFPIPANELMSNPALEQNKGY